MLSARGETSDKYPGTRHHIRKGLREDSRWRIRTLRLDDPAGYLEGFRTEGCATCLAGSASSGFFTVPLIRTLDEDGRRPAPQNAATHLSAAVAGPPPIIGVVKPGETASPAPICVYRCLSTAENVVSAAMVVFFMPRRATPLASRINYMSITHLGTGRR